MPQLSENEKRKIIDLIKSGKPLPAFYKSKLFAADDVDFVEATKDYKLIYKGKARKEDIIANTPAAPLQEIRSFNSDNRFDDGWSNMLIFGDNLFALKAIYEDQQGANKLKTKNKIKIIYIDPPFATKQDFMKDREKAYHDKIIGAQFIEFLRKRLILMREVLADDGSIIVHLDQKKGHYIKCILDEVFGETNFINDIIWRRFSSTGSSKAISNKFPVNHDSLYWYSRGDAYNYQPQFKDYSAKYLTRFKYEDNDGRGRYRISDLKSYSEDTLKRLRKENKLIEPSSAGAHYSYKRYLSELQGIVLDDVWTDIFAINPMAGEKLNYPTQKPEELLARIINALCSPPGIVLDAFVGSGTTLAVAEKVGRRWIGMDCGKLSIYTSQKRLLNLRTQIGSEQKDVRREHERVEDLEDHSKANSRGLLMVYDKARRGELNITDEFLAELSAFISKHLKGNNEEKFSLVCPEDKFKIKDLKVVENEGKKDAKAGAKIIEVGRVRFLISFIKLKEKNEKTKPLKAKHFTVYHAGIYDQKEILKMDWEQYRPFVAQLFDVRLDPHKIRGFTADGYIGTNSAYIWEYPKQKKLVLDEKYVETLHDTLGGRASEKFYIIAPISAMGFMQDEILIGKTTYVFLKVPLSVLMAIIEKGEPGALRQPTSESDVNEVIDAIGFDFISQPMVQAKYLRKNPEDKNLFNQGKKDYVIKISKFLSNTLVYDPGDFENFETLSLVMVDVDYNTKTKIFDLDKVYWANDIINEDQTRAEIRIAEDDFKGETMMIIFMDKYGNEYKITKTKKDFV